MLSLDDYRQFVTLYEELGETFKKKRQEDKIYRSTQEKGITVEQKNYAKKIWTEKLLSNEYLPHETPNFENDLSKMSIIYKVLTKKDYITPEQQ